MKPTFKKVLLATVLGGMPISVALAPARAIAEDSFIQPATPETTNNVPRVSTPESTVSSQQQEGTNAPVAPQERPLGPMPESEPAFIVDLDPKNLQVDPVAHPDFPHFMAINELFWMLYKRLPRDVYQKDYRYPATSLSEILELYRKNTVKAGNSDFTENFYLLLYQYYDASYSLDKDRKTNLKKYIEKADAAAEAIARAHGWTIMREKGKKPFVQPPSGMSFSKPTAQSILVNTERLLPQDADLAAEIGLSAEEIALLKSFRFEAIKIRDTKGSDTTKVIDYAGRNIIDNYDKYGYVLHKIEQRVKDNLSTEIKEAPKKLRNHIEALKRVKQYGAGF